MAKYTVTHTCGHTTPITLYGKTSERECRMKWLSEHPCKDCIRAEETRRAHAQAEKRNLPPRQCRELLSRSQCKHRTRLRDPITDCNLLGFGRDRFGGLPVPCHLRSDLSL